MTGVLGAVRPDSWNLPLFVHVLGAMILEMTGGKEFKIAAKAGAGAVIGLLIGVVGKFSICVMMIGLFATNTIYRTMNQPQPQQGERLATLAWCGNDRAAATVSLRGNTIPHSFPWARRVESSFRCR